MSITWQNSTGDILNQTTSDNRLELVFDPVTDSPSLQGAEFTCSVAGGAEVATQSFQVALISELYIIFTADLHVQWNLS